MKRIILLFLFSCFVTCQALAFNWKELHEKADSIELKEALAKNKSNPESLEGIYVLGLVYLNLHQDNRAAEAFTRVFNKSPETIGARWGIAEVLRRQHKSKDAKEKLIKIIEEDPSFSPAYISLAYLKYIDMDFNGSAALALKVINQGRDKVDLSNYVRAYAMYAGAKGMIAHYGGVLSKAINGLAVEPNLKKAQKLSPDSPAVLFGLGSYYFLAPVIAGGDKVKAEEYLKKAVEKDPLFADAYVRLAQLYSVRKDSAKYQFYMKKALEIDPQNVLALDHNSKSCKFICAGGDETVK